MCYLSRAAWCLAIVTSHSQQRTCTRWVSVAAGPYGCALLNTLNSFTTKIMVRSYYTISVYTKPDLNLFLFNLYLCSFVDLGGFMQVYVRPESKPLLCQ